jgi:hypothetical protein
MFHDERFMNARKLLFACLVLVIGSIVVVPVSAFLGVKGNGASTLSSLAMLGGIVAAFLTVKVERDSGEE